VERANELLIQLVSFTDKIFMKRKTKSVKKESKPKNKKLKAGLVCCDNCPLEFPKSMAHITEEQTLCSKCAILAS
jgi:formylmethanofuran dehydrogenase subunit E